MTEQSEEPLICRGILIIIFIILTLGCWTPVASATIQDVADVIYEYHQTINPSDTELTEEQAHLAANQILYLIGEYKMNADEDLPYILSLFYQESKFDPLAENNYSTASGFGQILLSYHSSKFDECGKEWRDIECNIYISFMIFTYNPDISNPYNRWVQALSGYCGSRSAAISTVRHHILFEEILNERSEDNINSSTTE